jgi:hypothetical protein
MTELAIRNDTPAASVAMYQTAAVERLAEWASSAQAAYTVAEKLVQTSFVPASFSRKAMEATAAILAGAEVGLSPMAALRSFDVIQGQAAPRAITLRAIVQSFGHEIELVESTATRCRMRGRRRDSQTWQSVTWTLDRAKDLGLTGKDNWKKQPQAMLVARATSELARLIAADAILGIGYTSEEIRDGLDTVNESVAGPTPDDVPAQETPASGTRRMSRRPKDDPETEPEPDAPQMITDAQSRKLHATLKDVGLVDRDSALAWMSNVIDVEIGSTKDLTKEQASQVIEALNVELQQQANAETDTDEPTFDVEPES